MLWWLMEVTDVVALVEKTWKDAKPDRRYAAVQNLRIAIPTEHHSLFDCLLDAKLTNIEDDPTATVLLLVHGIQTDGAWQKIVQEALSDVDKLNVIELGYDCVTPLQLISPFRSAPVNKVLREIRDIKQREPQARLMVIAHSFGSYIVSRILHDHSDIQFERIVLCGSIVPRDFRWDKHAPTMKHGAILNDIGTNDFYPVLATFGSFGYGSSGRLGFKTGRVVDRYFPYGHSTFFDKKRRHIKRFWKPFIQSGEVKESGWNTRKPKTTKSILMLSHPWIGRPFVMAVIVFLLWIVL